MKISFNPSNSNKNILDLIKNNKDIIFDLKGHSIFARGVEFKGTDTNTWRDIKINNVSIGSHTLDLRNGSNTTLTNTNGVVTINSTWRPVVDNLTSDSTTSSLSAKQGKVLKALIDDKSNSDHNHDGRYLKLTGGVMDCNARINFADTGSWSSGKKPQGARGGLFWTGQSDQAKLYAEETAADNLDLVIQFGDDNSNGLSIRNKTNTQTSYISSSGVITTGTLKGNLDWSYITNKPATATRWPSWAEVTGKPSSFTPSTHTHGLSNSVFFLNMPYIKGNAKWKEIFGYPVNNNLLLSVRVNSPAPEWCVGNYGSGILYGGDDTKGFMSSSYHEPFIMWAGGNGSTDDSVPRWYIGIKGANKSIYNLATIASEANAAYNFVSNITGANYYWANVKISASSSTTTSPTVHTLTATRVCAGHNPEIDNSISCSNWFRSSGNTGWYNSTYQGGWYMSDTSWIRAHNGVGIYTSGQIYSSKSIRMGNILLEYTNDINVYDSDSINLNLRSSADVSLCAGGGKVGIGTMYPSYKLDVHGYTHTQGFGIGILCLSDSGLLPVVIPSDGNKYRCLEIGKSTKVSCIIADKLPLSGVSGILLKFMRGYDGQIILLKDMENYGSGNGFFWVMPVECRIIFSANSYTIVNQNEISSAYDDGQSRFFIYASKYSAWIEFACG